MKHPRIVVRTQVYLLLPVILLLLPDLWLLSWIGAAMLHEGFHLLAIKLSGVQIHNIEIGLTGAKIETEDMDRWKECITAFMGPVGALTTLIFSSYIPRVAICAMIQSAFNLLPVFPLDGGRVFRCLFLYKLRPIKRMLIEMGILFALFLCCLSFAVQFHLGILFLAFPVTLVSKYINANSPCKENQHRVQ